MYCTVHVAQSPCCLLTAKTQITNWPIDTVVRVNHTAFFHCEASYNPAIDITYDWYHNDYKIQFVKIRVIGDTQHVEIEEHFERVSHVTHVMARRDRSALRAGESRGGTS